MRKWLSKLIKPLVGILVTEELSLLHQRQDDMLKLISAHRENTQLLVNKLHAQIASHSEKQLNTMKQMGELTTTCHEETTRLIEASLRAFTDLEQRLVKVEQLAATTAVTIPVMKLVPEGAN